MRQGPVLVTVLFAIACGGATEPTETDPPACPELFVDADGDGYGDANAASVVDCDPVEGYVDNALDCDDTRSAVNPDAAEVCDPDGVDEDCSGAANDDDPGITDAVQAWPDADADGFGDDAQGPSSFCEVPEGWALQGGDCDDAVALVNPDATEVCDELDVDEDCNGLAEDDDPGATLKTDTWSDADGDGYGDDAEAPVPYCDLPAGRSWLPGDCDDAEAAVNPGATEVCDPNDVDEDCSGAADDADPGAVGLTTVWPDADGDGFGDDDAAPVDTCDPIPGTVGAAGDCDDVDSGVFPGAAPLDDPAACMADTDGDGWGDLNPGGSVTPGSDCEPDDATMHPGAADPFDGVDQDCDAYDGSPLFDDFETGAPDAAVWAVVTGNVAATTTYVGAGTTSLDVYGNTGVIESVALDTSSCDVVFWSYLGMNGGAGAADAGDYLHVEYFDGTDWYPVDVWEGGSADLNVWKRRSGALTHATAFQPGFKLRFRGDSTIASDHFYIDDVSVGCAVEADGDATPDRFDCDAADPDHWADCGACVDGDGDGFGDGCDLGIDCDDADAAVHPGAADTDGDGLDADCSGTDGDGFFDDFEAGAPDARWRSQSGATYTTATSSSPTHALELGSSSEIVTAPVDLSACSDGVHWSYQGLRQGADAGEALVLSYDDGGRWLVADAWDGDGSTDAVFQHRWGVIPALSGAGLRFRLQGSASLTSETWIVDDFELRCFVDGDADGVPDSDDCDTSDPLHWSDCGSCIDADLDGRGNGCDLGQDCDDTDATVFPGAPDAIGDGVDTSCDGVDGAFVFEDFESGATNPYVWNVATGATVTDTYVGEGRFAFDFADDTGVLESIPLDLSTCGSVFWHYLGMTGGAGAADTGDFLYVEYWDGTAWQPIDTWEGGGPTDVWSARYGVLRDASALHAGFRLRFRGVSSIASDHFYVDGIFAGCADADTDGDGLPAPLDCDDTDADHWFDCGACVDTDGDGFGHACDLGADCDDADPAVHPLAADTATDGVDQDCDLVDGPALFSDDFESGGPDASVWPFVTGNVIGTTAHAGEGTTALEFWHDTGVIESVVVDTSACDTVVWRFLGMNGGDGAADANDFLHVEYWDGAAWVAAGAWEGGPADHTWNRHHGLLSDASAKHAGFQLRLRGDANLASDHFYVDDLAVGCAGADLDGDGLPSGLDCDDNSAAHWSDCGLCADGDGDGYGRDCDLGDDCDESDPAIHPAASDTSADGIDQDCNVIDGSPLFSEDFETGGPDPSKWALVTGNVAATTTYVGNGTTAVDIFGNTGVLESVAIDTRTCDAVVWRWLGMNGGAGAADTGDFLYLEYYDGTDWRLAHTWEGGTGDDVWRPAVCVITDPAARHVNFMLRLSGDSTIASDHFYLDDIQVGCSGDDADGDGMPSGLDCDDTDAMHWSDCGLCVDGDGDGHGVGCDPGPDCDDADPGVNPGATDVLDGVDQNCDDVDGPAWTDDLDTGAIDPAFWSSVTGDYAVVNGVAASAPYSLQLGGGGAVAETLSFDTSACDVVTWSFMGKRGPEQPDATDVLTVQWWDGAAWRTLEEWVGNGSNDPDFSRHMGFLSDAAAIGPDFRLRFDYPQTSSGAGLDQFHVDDVTVGCSTPDSDGDGQPDSHDCDPADGWHWAGCGLCVDVDGDGFGLGCDLGGDCADGDATTFPGAPDTLGDGVDTDCSGMDGQALFEDFESGSLGNWRWRPAGDHVWVGSAHVANGTYALRVEGGGVVESLPVDLGACNGLAWSYEGKRGPSQPEAADSLDLEIRTATGWQLADTWAGGVTDATFVSRSGVFVDPTLDPTAVELRFVGNGIVGDDWFVDDLWVRCLVDDDGDLAPNDADCAPNDPWHWSDCGLCVDGDGDGYGFACDLGADCDDADPTTNPDAADLGMDGFDQDCDFIDGPPLVMDDFETGGPDASVWTTITGDVAGTGQYVGAGTTSLDVFGNTGVLESVAVDTSVCQTVVWRYLGMNGGAGAADLGDFLHLEWWDGAAWVPLDTWEGGPAVDWHVRYGLLNDPAALHPAFALRVRGDSTITSDHFYVDDLAVGCAASDNDGDGLPYGLDCDDTDPLHWSDCGLCVDLDGDDFGTGCDLGGDCDDADAAVHPGAPDTLGDGIDSDCSGVDGGEFFDDFESGAQDARWVQLDDAAYSTETSWSGTFALEVGRAGDARTLPLDLSTCSTVLWSYYGKREGADAGEMLTLSWSAGGAPVQADAWDGDGSTDPGFVHRFGIIHDPAILAAGVEFRLEGDSSTATETWFVDDLTIACDPVDADGDGFPTGIDCDDTDFWHWSDCGLCVDVDGDGFGLDCDLGEDCDDADQLVNPAMPDAALDGVDANCDTLDTTVLQDDFESAPGIFVAFGGQNAVVEPVGIACAAGFGGGCGDVLHLEGASDAETTTWDSTSCTTIGFAFEGRRGPATPEAGDDVVVEWSTGMVWVEAYRWAGGAADPDFLRHSGIVTDPAAFSPNLRFRFRSDGIVGDDWYIDDVRLGCVD